MKKPKITSPRIVTAGVTADGRYSLAINEVDGRDCLCVHKCEVVGGLHWSAMNDKSLVTCIGINELRFAVSAIERSDAGRGNRDSKRGK